MDIDLFWSDGRQYLLLCKNYKDNIEQLVNKEHLFFQFLFYFKI